MKPTFTPLETFIHRITNQHRTPAAAIPIATSGQPAFTCVAEEASSGTPATEYTL